MISTSRTKTIDELARQCKEEQANFVVGIETRSSSCFELFRHALEHNNTHAFTHIYRTYESQVRHWVYRHSRYPTAQEDVDYFVQQALTKFYFALRGKDFDRFEHLSQVMRYLKLCVHSAIMQYWRQAHVQRSRHVDESRLDTVPVSPVSTTVVDAWQRILELLSDPKDQRLAYYVFVQGMKPADVVRQHTDEWPAVRDVYTTLYRIRRTLRSDATLHDLLLGPPSP